MKLEILQENFNRALTALSRIIVNKPQIPILTNILLAANSGKLVLTASNLETTIIVETGAKVTAQGEFTVPGRTLAEIVGSIPAEKIQLEVTQGSLNLQSGSFTARVNGIVASEYPKPPPVSNKDDSFWEVDRQAFQKALAATTFASASDEGRAALTGVLFKPKENGLILAATDGFRLSVVNLDKITLSQKGSLDPIIVPARSLSELTRVLAEKKAEKAGDLLKIYISSAESQIFFDLGDTKIFSRLVAGNFPDYEKIIPTESSLKIITTAEELTETVRLASIFARDSANIVKLKIADSKLSVSAAAAQVGENESRLDVSLEGKNKADSFTVAFNYRYLLDFLAVVTGQLSMEFSGPVSPGVFRAASSPNFFHIIMPVRVQD